ncbi:MAG TPA: DUF6049 family protein [Mycobacteriales bacterium]|nr:DUF6049 family protein [Mycobacteriales bacterium]
MRTGADADARRHPSGLPRSLAAVLMACGLAGTVAGTAAPAVAAPATTATNAVTNPVTTAPTTPGRPRASGPTVRVSVEQMSPRDLTGADDHQKLTVTGRLTNSGPVPLESVRLRVQRGPVISTRSELHQTDDAQAPLPVVRSCRWQSPDLPHGLPLGASTAFSYRCDLDTLGMTLIGIYPLALRVEAVQSARGVSPQGVQESTAPSGYQPAGEVRTYLPSFPQGVTARTQVDWLWPLVDRPHRLAETNRYLDDDLGRSVAPDGRLDRMLSVAEHAPDGTRLTLVVDPELVDGLSQMEHGYQVRSGARWVPGRFAAAATAWLDRLAKLAAHYPVAALPYGDPDVVALGRAGASDLARITPADRALIAHRLGTTPITTLAWPPGGAVTPEALGALVDQGFQAVVLGSAALPGRPVTGPTPGSVTRLHSPGQTQAVALVTDPDLIATVRDSRGFPSGPRLAEQRYLTELAMITAEAPSRGRALIVAPPHRWDPDPVSAAAMLADTTAMSWLAPGSAAELAHHRPDVDRGPLVYPAAARRSELPRTLVDGLVGLRAQIEDFGSAPVSRQAAERVVAPYLDAVRRGVSSAWRSDPNGPTYLAGLRAQVDRLRSSVHIVKPSGSGVYVLASSNSPLILTVANDLPEPIRFRVRITSRGTPGFTVSDIGEQVIQAQTRRTIQIPATVQRSGLFVVNALVTTPAGRPLGVDGQPVRLKVRSTAYGLIGLVITGFALALLLLLMIRRLVLRIRHRGAGGGARGSGPGSQRPGRDATDAADATGTGNLGDGPLGETTLDTTLGAQPLRTPAPVERSAV